MKISICKPNRFTNGYRTLYTSPELEIESSFTKAIIAALLLRKDNFVFRLTDDETGADGFVRKCDIGKLFGNKTKTI